MKCLTIILLSILIQTAISASIYRSKSSSTERPFAENRIRIDNLKTTDENLAHLAVVFDMSDPNNHFKFMNDYANELALVSDDGFARAFVFSKVHDVINFYRDRVRSLNSNEYFVNRVNEYKEIYADVAKAVLNGESRKFVLKLEKNEEMELRNELEKSTSELNVENYIKRERFYLNMNYATEHVFEGINTDDLHNGFKGLVKEVIENDKVMDFHFESRLPWQHVLTPDNKMVLIRTYILY